MNAPPPHMTNNFYNESPVPNQAGRNININDQNFYYGHQPDPLLKLAVAPQAAFNARRKDDNPPQCLPTTRVQILQQIRKWADGDDERCIFWLSGWAGAGKSTIARTIAREYYDEGCFTASFFFSRDDRDVSHAGKFVSSIAMQLSQRSAAFKSLLINAISNDEGISSKILKDQWNELVLQPLSKFQAHLLIVIDALDECEESDVRQLLHLLSDSRRLGRLGFRIFITSRPEISVHHGFSLVPGQDRQELILHDISQSIVKDDIFTFLQHELSDIQQKWGLAENWPGEEAIRHLVRKAAGLFIWAATASRFIDDGGDLFGPDRLFTILQGDSPDIGPEEALNEIYAKVLEKSTSSRLKQRDKEKAYEILREALGAIVTLYSPLPAPSLAQLLGRPVPRGLHSILYIPKDSKHPVRLHHPSLRDFLLSSQRCQDHFLVDEKKAHEVLANHCIRLLSKKLKKDVCGVGSPGRLTADVETRRVEQCIPPEAQYACLYWIQHLLKSGIQVHDNDQVHTFLKEHLLHWLEALGWMKKVSEGIHAIVSLESMTTSRRCPQLSEFIHDMKRFVLYNRAAIACAPLQTYCGALVFVPTGSTVRKQFQDDIPKWMRRLPDVDKDWSALLQTVEGHTGPVNAVAFSPNSQLLASASRDYSVRLWDAVTGVALQTLEGHTSSVNAVAFSPDSKLLASASGGWSLVPQDFSVRLWDAVTRETLYTLDGHTQIVNAVTFSPTGKLLASASGYEESNDNTVRLWDVAAGAALRTLNGHQSSVNAVAFSPDRKLLVSASGSDRDGSSDRTIRLWDAATGAALQTLEGHTGPINAVAFSRDSKLLASASGSERHREPDDTVRLWDVATGAVLQILEGHTWYVRAVTFSPNEDKLLASASDDRTVRLWDTMTGAVLKTLEGHTDSVNAVAFSPDSKLLASASDDKTVRLWDIMTGAALQTLKGYTVSVDTLEGHTASVSALTFSPDGKLLVSASGSFFDGDPPSNNLRLWDAATGATLYTLDGHTKSVNAVTFSPNGKLLASASNDKTVRLWDAVTGAALQTFQGHTESVNAVIFCYNSKLLASASGSFFVFNPFNNNDVRLWNAATGEMLRTLRGHVDSVNAVAFSPDDKLLASASGCEQHITGDNTVRLWNLETGGELQTLKGHTKPVNAVAFSPDCQLLASASSDNTVRLWNATKGEVLYRLEVSATVSKISFFSDGQYLKTDRGILPVQSSPSRLPPPQIFVKGDWITQHMENLLWLPLEYRGTCSAVYSNIVVLGQRSGQVIFIELNLA